MMKTFMHKIPRRLCYDKPNRAISLSGIGFKSFASWDSCCVWPLTFVELNESRKLQNHIETLRMARRVEEEYPRAFLLKL